MQRWESEQGAVRGKARDTEVKSSNYSWREGPKVTADVYLNVDRELATTDTLTDSEIVTVVTDDGDAADEEEEEEEEEKATERPTSAQCHVYLDKLESFLDLHDHEGQTKDNIDNIRSFLNAFRTKSFVQKKITDMFK